MSAGGSTAFRRMPTPVGRGLLMEIKDLAPQAVFSHFQNICAIPHPSGYERGIAKYIISFAREHGLEFELEDQGNVIVKKKATPGREHSPVVILQAHMDMVPVARAGVEHDFVSQAIRPCIVTADAAEADPKTIAVCGGPYIRATNTTLGADDGLGVALILALLGDDELSHGPLTAIFTVEEESTMKGAQSLDHDYLQGDYLINLDSEEFDTLFVGCAGSINANITFTPELVKVVDCTPIVLNLTGLTGGHSGSEIHLNRGNAIDIMCGILAEVSDTNDFFIQKFQGGEIRNSIPSSAYVELAVPSNTFDEFKAAASAAMVRYQELYADTDPQMHLILGTCPLQPTALSYTSSQNLISFLRALPNGVIRLSHDYENVVETSCNLSLVRTKQDTIAIALLARSLKDHGLDDVIDKLDCICSLLDNVDVGFTGRSFGWTSPKSNQLIEILKRHYQEQAGIDIGVTSIHAGLETGYFAKANPKLQMVSLGPTVRNAHSPDEFCSVEHTRQVYTILRSTLAEL